MVSDLTSFWDELVATADDPNRLLELIARRVADVVGEASVLTTVSEDGERLEPAAVFHADPEVRDFIRTVLGAAPYLMGQGVAGTVAVRREPTVVARVDPMVVPPDATLHFRHFLERYPIRSLVIVPMIAYGEVVGTLGAVRMESERPYGAEDVVAMEALAERAALALADARRRPGRIGPAEYEAIFGQSVDGILFTSPDGRILAANPAACRILGRSETEICRIGRAGVLVDDARTRAAVVRRAIAGRERAELSMRRGNGEIFTADVSSTVFTTVDGELRASVIFRDVSERVRSRNELEKQYHHLELLHRVTTAINEARDLDTAIQQTLDLVGVATDWPLGDALLVSNDGVLRPSSSWRLADAERFPWFRPAMEGIAVPPGQGLAGRAVASAAPVWISDLQLTPEVVRTVEVIPGPLRSYVGVPIMVGTAARGILELFSDEPRPRDDGLLAVLVGLGTQLGRALERTEVEAAHRRLDEERSAFVARAAHELRSPIAALMVAVGVLAGRELADPQDSQLVDLIVDSTDHLDRLVNRLLDLSSLEQATPALTIERLDVARAVERALATCPAPPGRTVTNHVPVGTFVLADELSLEQILTNLVANAYQYGGDDVHIDARRDDGRLRVSVADNGPGVDPAVEAAIFEPFTRGGADRRSPGVGLGLAICRRLADAMGGSLTHERRDNDGCRFVIELPTTA
jgi:PAS domain S-box-containing protein